MFLSHNAGFGKIWLWKTFGISKKVFHSFFSVNFFFRTAKKSEAVNPCFSRACIGVLHAFVSYLIFFLTNFHMMPVKFYNNEKATAAGKFEKIYDAA